MLTVSLTRINRYLRISGSFPDHFGGHPQTDRKWWNGAADNSSRPGHASLPDGNSAQNAHIGTEPDIIFDGYPSIIDYRAGANQIISVAYIVVAAANDETTLAYHTVVTNGHRIASGRLNYRLSIQTDILTYGYRSIFAGQHDIVRQDG